MGGGLKAWSNASKSARGISRVALFRRGWSRFTEPVRFPSEKKNTATAL
jgi:hypothetical protein